MEANKVLTFTITAVIVIILVATLLVPAVNMGALETKENENYVYRATQKLGDYEYALDTDNNLTLNGDVVTINTAVTNDINVGVASEILGYSYRGTSTPSNWLYSTDAGIQLGSTPLTINADGSWSAVKNGTTTTGTTPISKGIFAKNDGEMAVYWGSQTTNVIKVNTGVPIYIFSNYCQATKDSTTTAIAFLAEYKDGAVNVIYADSIPNTGGTPTDVSSDLTVNIITTSSELKDGVITYDGIRAGVTLSGYTWQGTISIAAPLEYKAYVDSQYSPLLFILPVFFILALVVSSVRLVSARD